MIFLIVASFILNVALTRALALQRPQIASLKALGYGNVAIGWHYLKWGFVIGAVGVAIGVVGGASLGTMIIGLYNTYFRFPELDFGVPLGVVVGAATLTFVAAGGGAFGAVVRAVRIPPAEAMRPEVPARYRRTLLETPLLSRYLGTAGRMVLRNLARHPFRAGASIFGISFAVAILMIGLVFTDATERLIQTQFWEAERQDVTVNFMEPRSSDARYALAHLPGVIAVEPQRSVAVRVRAGHRERYLAITGVPPTPRFRRIVDRNGEPIRLPPGGVVLSQTLANALDVTTGDIVTMEVLEGHRPTRRVEVSGLVDDLLGLSAYMDMEALHRLMQEGDVATGALMLVDSAQEAELSTTLKGIPTVAGTGFKRAVLRRFREVLAANLGLSIFINLMFASVIAFGVVYNAARISLSERSRELASLRVLGFTRAEISLILMGELALLTLVSLPVGGAFGYSLSALIVGSIDSEVYRFPLYVSRQAVAWSFLGIMGAALVSGLIVRRKLDALDLVAVLKIRE
jgi:putative ABC transport system permease protein